MGAQLLTSSWARFAAGAALLPAFAAGPAFAEAVAAAGGPPLWGEQVGRVEIRSDVAPPRHQEVARLVTVEPGRPLGREELARSLRNLHASGLGGEIEVWVRPGEGEQEGPTVIFALWSRLQIESVAIEGETGLKPAQLEAALLHGAAEPLVESRLLRSVYRLQDLLEDSGYLEARVRVAVEVDEARHRARVVYRVAAGEAWRVGRVVYEGELGGITSDQLTAHLQAPPEARYRRAVVRADAERLEEWLFGRGHRLAVVERARESHDPERRQVDLVYAVRVGPQLEVRVEGAELRELERKGLLPFLARDRYDEALVLRAEQRLTDFYQEKGHYRVAVDWREERDEERLLLVLTIEPGPVYQLEELGLTGNEQFAAGRLAELMGTAPRRLLVPGSGRLVDSVLAADLENLRSFYLLNGFPDVVVGPPRVGEEGQRLRVVVPIEEGRQRRVAEIETAGLTVFGEAELLAGLPLKVGGPFHQTLLHDSLGVIRARYEERGYESAQASATVEWSDDGTLADVDLRVLEGPRSVVDRVILRGNRRTQAPVVRRAMGLSPGMPLNTSRLLEVQRRLYELGIFSRVEVERSSGTPYSGGRDVVVRVEEGKPQKVSYGVGFDSEDGVRGLAGYSHSNLFGRAVSGRIDVRASQRDSLLRALLRQPQIGRFRLPVTYSLFRIEETEESFDSRRQGAQIELERRRGSGRQGLLFNYRLVEVLDPDPALGPLQIDRELREVEIASLTPHLFVDRRDDPLDPKRGWSSSLLFEVAFPFLDADAEFAKLFGQQTAYLDLGSFGVLAGSARLGAIEPLDGAAVEDPTLPPDLPSRLVPIAERFFAGGRTSHRAYRRDRLGIPGQTLLVADDPADGQRLVPVGGTGMVLVNLDYRFPIAGPVGGTLFVDAGNVWADWRSFDPTEIKTGTGLGIRYLSPIGPLRLEAGWKLDREPGEDPVVLFFSFGNTF